MPRSSSLAKRLLLGRPFRSDALHDTLLPKRLALPVFASDAMSSVAYAPQEIFLTLSVSGITAYTYAPSIGLVVALVMLVVVASYRQNVHAYPSGGGDYEVATVNIGKSAGLTVASALRVDYTLTVAVSISSATDNIGSAVPFIAANKVAFAVGAIVLLTAVNLRGLRESGTAFALPTYAFMLGIIVMIIWGLTRIVLFGQSLRAESAGFELVPEHGELTGLALAFLLLRSFSQGSAALTGVEAISNGVPAFRKPKSKNAATTLLLLGTISVTMLLGLVSLAVLTKVKLADDPAAQLKGSPAGYEQKTMVAQIAQVVFHDFTPGFYFIAAVTGLVLALAANTAFNGFPVLGSILAQDRYLPRQLHTRGDRLAFSNGILSLAAAAIILVVSFQANVTDLLNLYVVGVFVSSTVSQFGMIRHWNRLLLTETEPGARRRMRRSQSINAVGLTMTAAVLLVVLGTKFLAGAWIAILAMAAIYLVMTLIHRHYQRVALELEEHEWKGVLPSRNHTIVLVSKLHKPTIRALAYARVMRPDVLEAVTVNVDDADTRALVKELEDREIPVKLKVVESPYREITRPVLDYVRRVRRESPRDVVTVFVPEYVVGRWREQLLHNQSALRLKSRLLFLPGVMVTSVPWQLSSSQRAKAHDHADIAPGAFRRGFDEQEEPR
ncbi:MAG: APC family permease [Mycobacteriaceae bacterium]